MRLCSSNPPTTVSHSLIIIPRLAGLAPRVLCQGYATVKPKQRVGRNVVLVEGVRTPFMMSGTEYACLQHSPRLRAPSVSSEYEFAGTTTCRRTIFCAWHSQAFLTARVWIRKRSTMFLLVPLFRSRRQAISRARFVIGTE